MNGDINWSENPNVSTTTSQDGSQSSATASSGDDHKNFWDFGTAVIDLAGNVLGLFDKNGNPVPTDHIDALQTIDNEDYLVEKKDNTMYYILGGMALVILLIVLVVVLNKK